VKILVLLCLLCSLIGCRGLHVHSDIPGATVLIDGQPTQYNTPCKIPLKEFPMGNHLVTIRMEGYKTPPPIAISRVVSASAIVLTVFFTVPFVVIYPFTNEWTRFKEKDKNDLMFTLEPLASQPNQ